MADIKDKSQKVAIVEETTQGTYKAVSSPTEYLQVQVDGIEMSKSKDVVERNLYTSSIGVNSPRVSTTNASGSIKVECRAGEAQGQAPEFSLLLESALGASKRQWTADIITGEDHTTSKLFIENADIAQFSVGDIVMIKEVGRYHVSPIIEVDSTSVDKSITLEVAASAAFSDKVAIAKATQYSVGESGHKSLSVVRYLNDAVIQYIMGAKVSGMTLEGFSTGQLSSFNFGFQGVDFDSKLQAPTVQPNYQDSLPPIILSACVFMDGQRIELNDFSLSLENTVAKKTATCKSNGIASQSTTQRVISGSINPYMKDDTMDVYNKFKNNTAFSIFAYMQLPSEVAGEPKSIVAFYLPNCNITDLSEGKLEGILQDNITFSANRGSAGTKKELHITFI